MENFTYSKAMQSKTRSSLNDPRIELGRIIDVDRENHTCSVRSEMSEQFLYNISISSPYLNQTASQGIKWLPKGGETVIMAVLSDGRRVILGYVGVDEEGSHNYGFGDMNGGDYIIKGDNDSFFRMRAGGIVEVGSSPICTSIFIPTRNIIHSIAENWILDTFAGSLEFRTDRAEDDEDGHVPTHVSLNIKEFSDDENELVRLKIGGGQDNLACSLIIKDSGNGESTTIKITLSKEGDLNVKLERDFTMSVKKVDLKASDDISVTSSKNITQKASQAFKVSGNTVEIESNTVANVSAINLNLKSSQVRISNSASFPVIRASPELISLLTAVSAVVKIPLTSTHFNTSVLV